MTLPFESVIVSRGESKVTPVNALNPVNEPARFPIGPVIGPIWSSENVRPAFGPLTNVPLKLPGFVVKVKVPSLFTVCLKV